MRTISAAQEKVISSTEPSYHLRVQVKDSGGTFRALNTYPGINMIKSADWGESLDSPLATATVILLREQDALSLAPLMQASPLNRGFNPAAAYAALLAVNREIKIEVAVVSGDLPAASVASGDWMEVFRGYIDTIEDGDGEVLTLECRDLGAALMDTFIEWERFHGIATDGGTNRVGCRVWEPSRAFALGEYVISTAGMRNGAPNFYEVTTAGTSGTAEPDWPASSTVADNTIVWTFQAALADSGQPVAQAMQGVLNANGQSAVTLQTSGTPDWNVRGWKQNREALLTALQNLAMQIGWECRYRWNSGSGAFLLTFYEPTRSGASVSRTFAASEYIGLGNIKIDNSMIRNVIRVIYPDRTALDSSGNMIRQLTESSDSTSITTYGRRFMEITEAKTSNIDTSTEADRMADACLADLKDPVLEFDVELAYGFPWAEVGDVYSFSANGRHFSATQTLAAYSIKHSASEGTIRTQMSVRGAPGIGPRRWSRLDGRAGNELHSLQNEFGSSGVKISGQSIPGGAQLTLENSIGVTDGLPSRYMLPEEIEWHIGSSSTFTPDSTTLQAVTQARDITITDLLPGTTYFAKFIPKSRNTGKLVAGRPSDPVTIVAGRNSAGHLKSEVTWGRIPINGGFETRLDTSGMPDHWAQTGIYGTNALVQEGSGAVSGTRYIALYCRPAENEGVTLSHANDAIVKASQPYRFEFWRKCVAGSDNLAGLIGWQTSTHSAISNSGVTVALTDNVGTWIKSQTWALSPATAKFGLISFSLVVMTEERNVEIDEIELAEADPCHQWHFSGDNLDAGGTTQYAYPSYHGSGGLTTTEIKVPAVGPGLLTDLRVLLRTASTDVSYAVTVRKGGSDTALTATVAAAATTAADTTNAVVVAAGDQISVKVVSAVTGGGPVAGDDIQITFKQSY